MLLNFGTLTENSLKTLFVTKVAGDLTERGIMMPKLRKRSSLCDSKYGRYSLNRTNATMTIRNIVMAFQQSRLIRNVSTVAGSLLVAQVISLTFAPYLARIYGPEAFGILAAFVAITTVLSPTVTLGYASAIVLPRDDDGAVEVARLSLLCTFFFIPISFASIWLFEDTLAALTKLEHNPGLLYLVPLSSVSIALLSIAESMAIRKSLFKANAIAKVFSTLATNTGKLALGVMVPAGSSLIAVTVLGTGLNFIVLLSSVSSKGGFLATRWFGIKGTWNMARKYKDFPLYRLPQSVVNAAGLGLPVLLLTSFYGSAAAGQYSFTSVLLGAPALLVGKSVLDVFYPRISREIEEDRQKAAILLRKATQVSTLFAVAVFGLIALVSSTLFPVLFGEEWARAGLYAQWVSFWMASVVVSRPSVASLPALGLQKHLLIYEVLVTIGRIAALYLGALYWNDLVAVAAFSGLNVLGYLFLILLCLRRLPGR